MFSRSGSGDKTLRRKIFERIIPGTVLLFLVTTMLVFNFVVSRFSRQAYQRVVASSLNFTKTAGSSIQEAIAANTSVSKNHLSVNGIIDGKYRQAALVPFFNSLVLPGPDEQVVMMTDYRGKILVSNLKFEDHESARNQQVLAEIKELTSIWRETVLRKGRTYVGQAAGYLLIASPVIYGNQPEGAVVSVYPLDSFFREIAEVSSTSVTGFEHDGLVLASADEDIIKEGVPLEVPDGWISTVARIPCLPSVKTIVFESKGPIDTASNAVLLAMGIYFVVWSVGVSLAFWYATELITDPLENLVSRIKEVQETGDLSLRVSEQGTRELNNLSSSFNRMLAQLDKTTVSAESYRKLALVAKYTDNAVVISDAKGNIEWTNDGFTRMTGFELDEVIGKKPGSFLQGESTDPETVRMMHEATQMKQGFDVEIVNYSKSGKPYWVAIESRPISNADGIVEKFVAIEKDITERKRSEAEKEKLSRELQESARAAGMAEIATGVLHNVGNVLNSVNITTSLLIDQCKRSRLGSLSKASEIIENNRERLGEFLTKDEQGKHFPKFFKSTIQKLEDEQQEELKELQTLSEHVNHIKETIAFQQSYAKQGGVIELVDVAETMDSVLKMNEQQFAKYGISVRREFIPSLSVTINKHKLLQIVINLVTNAKHALRDSSTEERELAVIVEDLGEHVQIAVKDNGIGISKENLEKIFVHGFTTKNDGHGFGLHSSALAAQEIGGRLDFHSDGVGLGAAFTLRIPKSANTSQRSFELDSLLA